jgi:5'-3' exonuclease
MGIPSYFSYIVKNHSEIIKKISNDDKNKNKDFNVNNLYLDCNSIIYDVIHSLNKSNTNEPNFEVVISLLCDKIDKYILDIKPDNNIFIAFDGVAPVAKLEQQRTRRYKSVYTNNISKSIFGDTKPDTWNTTFITPGTIFMKKLNESIRKKYSNPKDFNVNRIILSPSDKFGEGEHKIFEFIRTFSKDHKSQNTVIYGLDADLIMLCINHLNICPNIYLFRETPEFIKSMNSELEPNENYILDIPQLAKIITLNMNNGTCDNYNNKIYDYIFMCFFLGNDFMPHFPSINIRTGGIDKMLNAYKAVIGDKNEYLTDGNKIYWKNVRKLVQHLASLEEEYLKNETKLRDKRAKYIIPDTTPEEKYKKFDLIPNYDRSIEKSINPFKHNWQNRYYKYLFNLEINENHKKEICINYLEGLEWTMKYYTTGCPNWRWCYNYNYPPLLSDLIHHIPYFEKDLVIYKTPNPVTEIVQLSYVLPKQSLHLLPEQIYNKLLNERSEWYKSDCNFIWAYCRYFWESHVDLPDINIDELETLLIAN